MKKRALILVDHGSTVKEANELLAAIAERIRKSGGSGFDIVRHSHMELSEPTLSQAFDECVSLGAEEIVVHPYFLAPGRHSTSDIPRMVEEAASSHSSVAFSVTEPLGVHDKIIEVILERSGGRNNA